MNTIEMLLKWGILGRVGSKMYFYSIHVIAEYNLSGSKIICQQIFEYMCRGPGKPLIRKGKIQHRSNTGKETQWVIIGETYLQNPLFRTAIFKKTKHKFTVNFSATFHCWSSVWPPQAGASKPVFILWDLYSYFLMEESTRTCTCTYFLVW